MKLNKEMVKFTIIIVAIEWITFTLILGILINNWWMGSIVMILPVGMILAMGLLKGDS